jgi:hypothetical protein
MHSDAACCGFTRHTEPLHIKRRNVVWTAHATEREHDQIMVPRRRYGEVDHTPCHTGRASCGGDAGRRAGLVPGRGFSGLGSEGISSSRIDFGTMMRMK